MMYLDSNNGVFPACASRSTYGFQVDDWIYWRPTLPGYPIQNSLIVAHLGTGTSSSNSSGLFRCPADVSNKDRDLTDPYMYSYTIVSYGLNNGQSPGISSIRDGGGWHPFKQVSIRKPSKTLMIVEEQTVATGSEASDVPAGGVSTGAGKHRRRCADQSSQQTRRCILHRRTHRKSAVAIR